MGLTSMWSKKDPLASICYVDTQCWVLALNSIAPMVYLSTLFFVVNTLAWSPSQKSGLAVSNNVAGTIKDKLTMSHDTLRTKVNVNTIQTYELCRRKQSFWQQLAKHDYHLLRQICTRNCVIL